MINYEIVYNDEKYFNQLYKIIDSVAKELIYIEILEAPEYDLFYKYNLFNINNKYPNFIALCADAVVGWIECTPLNNPIQKHRGILSMGIADGYRGMGIGSKMLSHVINYSKSISLEKIELVVYPHNLNAFNLYIKYGFEQYGYIKNYRKINDKYFDGILMEKFL